MFVLLHGIVVLAIGALLLFGYDACYDILSLMVIHLLNQDGTKIFAVAQWPLHCHWRGHQKYAVTQNSLDNTQKWHLLIEDSLAKVVKTIGSNHSQGKKGNIGHDRSARERESDALDDTVVEKTGEDTTIDGLLDGSVSGAAIDNVHSGNA